MSKRSRPDEFRLPTASELQDLRLLVDMTQQEVADELGISRATVSHWESGTQSPSLEQAKRLLSLYADRFDENNILWRSSNAAAGDFIRRLFGLPID